MWCAGTHFGGRRTRGCGQDRACGARKSDRSMNHHCRDRLVQKGSPCVQTATDAGQARLAELERCRPASGNGQFARGGGSVVWDKGAATAIWQPQRRAARFEDIPEVFAWVGRGQLAEPLSQWPFLPYVEVAVHGDPDSRKFDGGRACVISFRCHAFNDAARYTDLPRQQDSPAIA